MHGGRVWQFSLSFSILVNAALGVVLAMFLRQYLAPPPPERSQPVRVRVVSSPPPAPVRKPSPPRPVPHHAAPRVIPPRHLPEPHPHVVVTRPATPAPPRRGHATVIHRSAAMGSVWVPRIPHPTRGGGGGGGGGRPALPVPPQPHEQAPAGDRGQHGHGVNPGIGTGEGAGAGSGQGSGVGNGAGHVGGNGTGDSEGDGTDAPGNGEGPFGIDDSPGSGDGPRHIVYLVDVSPSMESRVERTKQELRRAMSTLREGEMFDVIAFWNGHAQISRQLLPATPDNLVMANEKIDEVVRTNPETRPATDLWEALHTALRISAVNVVVVITDGEPTYPEWERDDFPKLEALVQDFNEQHARARIYPIGLIGVTPDGRAADFKAKGLLQQIAADSGGQCKFAAVGVATDN